jgi:hypothetical protein
MNDEFYVGYLAKAPAGLGKVMAWISAGILLAGCVVGAVLILDQPPFAAGRFEYGEYREYTGSIEEWPYPILVTSDASFVLVAPGKHGLTERFKGLQGGSVQLKGSLIERGGDKMLEVLPGSIVVDARQLRAASRQVVDLGVVTLRGEIVDTKCYLGVMNPGEHKVHRDCAARCISGGIPPAFVALDSRGVARVLLLTGEDGGALHKQVLSLVGEPLEVSGLMARSGATFILRTDPSRFRRIAE